MQKSKRKKIQIIPAMNCSVNVFGIKQLSTDKVDKPIKKYKTMDKVITDLIKTKVELIRKELDEIENIINSKGCYRKLSEDDNIIEPDFHGPIRSNAGIDAMLRSGLIDNSKIINNKNSQSSYGNGAKKGK